MLYFCHFAWSIVCCYSFKMNCFFFYVTCCIFLCYQSHLVFVTVQFDDPWRTKTIDIVCIPNIPELFSSFNCSYAFPLGFIVHVLFGYAREKIFLEWLSIMGKIIIIKTSTFHFHECLFSCSITKCFEETNFIWHQGLTLDCW